MYIEFIIIFIALGVIFLMLAVAIILLIKLLKNGSTHSQIGYNQMFSQQNNSYGNRDNNFNSNNRTGNVVFCKNCATEFNASDSVCPNCGMPR